MSPRTGNYYAASTGERRLFATEKCSAKWTGRYSPGFNSSSNARSKHSFESIPKAWKLNSKRVLSPSQTVECFSDVMIFHCFFGLTSIAKRRLKLISQ